MGVKVDWVERTGVHGGMRVRVMATGCLQVEAGSGAYVIIRLPLALEYSALPGTMEPC